MLSLGAPDVRDPMSQVSSGALLLRAGWYDDCWWADGGLLAVAVLDADDIVDGFDERDGQQDDPDGACEAERQRGVDQGH